MKRITGYFLSMIMVFILLLFGDFVIFSVVCFNTDAIKHYISVEKLSERISCVEGEYSADPSAYELLDAHDSFAMIIDEAGDVVWNYKMPSDIPSHYGIKEVSSFSRWYLNDYPVYTWTRDEGILVVGRPKNGIWKYSLDFNMKTLDAMLRIFPYMLIINLLILIVLPVLITRRWTKNRERARTEWIAGVSHDIRTPLSIVMGSVEKGSVVEKQWFKIRDLIGNLNTENKLESGTGKWNDESIMLVPLLRDVICDFANTYEESFSFEPDIDDQLEDYSVKADSALVRRMIENVITNSVVHNEKGCTVSVSLKRNDKGKAVLTISDDGVGTDMHKLEVLNSKLKSTYLPEHGLGLRVVKQVAAKYRYAVRFSSEQGSYFKCEIVFA